MNQLKNKMLKNNSLIYAVVLLVGFLLGWMIFGGGTSTSNHEHPTSTTEEATIWTCSMHPQIKMDQAGLCPLCAMDLIPLKSSDSSDEMIDDDAIQLSKEAIALANIQTSIVGHTEAIKTVELYGMIQVDERSQHAQTSHVNGRIEKLAINFTGEQVKQGQLIATIYSPDVLTAQQELLEAKKLEEFQPALLQAAKEKLRLWKISEAQINDVLQSGKVSPTVNIYANASGTVLQKNVNTGDYITQGMVLFQIANLSQLWAVFDAYEKDLPFLKVGDPIEYSLQSIPGKVFKGKIDFINPLLESSSRTAKVRVEINNKDRLLKPEMYATAKVMAPLVDFSKEMVVPKSAVLWTGKRSVVYVKLPNLNTAAFQLRDIVLGPSLGDQYVVLSGLENGEEIVTNGAFTVDASAQLEGKTSMMNNDNAPHEYDPADKIHAMFQVSGNCSMCQSRIEKAAKSVKGVISAKWDVDTKLLHLDFDQKATSKNEISKAVAQSGHDTEFDKAPQRVYDDLPACCLYAR